MEVKKSTSKTKKDDESSFKGISLVFSKTIQQTPRLSSSATTWAAEEIKMKCIFNKGIAFCSNDTIRRNLSTEIKIPDVKSPNPILQQTIDDTSTSQNLEQIYGVSDCVNRSKTQFAADIYSLVKSTSNMLILEEMKANENIYNQYCGAIYTQGIDDSDSADKSLILNNANEIPNCNIDKPETVHSKENQDTIYDRNRLKDHTQILINTGEEVIEMEDIKNKINTTDLGPGVLTVAFLDEPSEETIEHEGSTGGVLIQQADRTLSDEIKVSTKIKDSTDSPSVVISTDEFSFTHSTISKKCENIGRMEYYTNNKMTCPYEDTKISLSRPFSRKIPKALSVIQETGYSDANFTDSVIQSLSDTKLDAKISDSIKLISSDTAINKTLYKIKLEPEPSTSAYKRIFKSLLYNSEDDALMTLEKNNTAEKDKQSIGIDKLKRGEPVEQKNDNNFLCEPF